jgi:hypothetical protein
MGRTAPAASSTAATAPASPAFAIWARKLRAGHGFVFETLADRPVDRDIHIRFGEAGCLYAGTGRGGSGLCLEDRE